MTLNEEAAARLALAEQLGREPVKWVATDTVATELVGENDTLHGVPLERGPTRSGTALELVLERIA